MFERQQPESAFSSRLDINSHQELRRILEDNPSERKVFLEEVIGSLHDKVVKVMKTQQKEKGETITGLEALWLMVNRMAHNEKINTPSGFTFTAGELQSVVEDHMRYKTEEKKEKAKQEQLHSAWGNEQSELVEKDSERVRIYHQAREEYLKISEEWGGHLPTDEEEEYSYSLDSKKVKELISQMGALGNEIWEGREKVSATEDLNTSLMSSERSRLQKWLDENQSKSFIYHKSGPPTIPNLDDLRKKAA